jgi:small subunit ribosomal protein S4
MARYTDPVCKLCRREGEKLFLKGERCLSPKCAIERRNFVPGMHGKKQQFRRKMSDYGVQLREKQKARRIYGVLERQFRRYFSEAQRRPGLTGENLLQLLERRLDNVVYRMGFADSRPQARQIVNHGHFTVNGKRLDIPSYIVKPGDVIAVRLDRRSNEFFQMQREAMQRKSVQDWLDVDAEQLVGRVNALPNRTQIDVSINEQLIVEYYSR